jgi:hypothetical protein
MAERRRWDTDEAYVGVATASAATDDVARLLTLTQQPGWVTEDPLAHLGPSCTRAAAELGIEIERMEVVEAVLEIDLRTRDADGARAPRVDAFGLIGAIAEGATYVRETRPGSDVILDVVTGVMPGDNAFATHGHLARIRILGA